MRLLFGIWLLGAAGVFGKPTPHRIPAVGTEEEINQRLIPKEAPDSSFLMEGDIIKHKLINTFTPRVLKWPKRNGSVIIPYVMSSAYDASDRKTLMEAFSDLQNSTCICFVNRTNERDYISIEPAVGCYSNVGRAGGMQLVSLAFECLRTERGKGVTLHELMHVAGFWHEHSRADRGDYIQITWNEIKNGYERNFCKHDTSNMVVKYELKSILHYSRYAFSRSGLPTITPRGPYSNLEIGQRIKLSPSDILRVNKYYSCSQYKPSTGEDEQATANSPPIIYDCSKERNIEPPLKEVTISSQLQSIQESTLSLASANSVGSEIATARGDKEQESINGPTSASLFSSETATASLRSTAGELKPGISRSTINSDTNVPRLTTISERRVSMDVEPESASSPGRVTFLEVMGGFEAATSRGISQISPESVSLKPIHSAMQETRQNHISMDYTNIERAITSAMAKGTPPVIQLGPQTEALSQTSPVVQSTRISRQGREGQRTSTILSQEEQNTYTSSVFQSRRTEVQSNIIPTEARHLMSNWSPGQKAAVWGMSHKGDKEQVTEDSLPMVYTFPNEGTIGSTQESTHSPATAGSFSSKTPTTFLGSISGELTPGISKKVGSGTNLPPLTTTSERGTRAEVESEGVASSGKVTFLEVMGGFEAATSTGTSQISPERGALQPLPTLQQEILQHNNTTDLTTKAAQEIFVVNKGILLGPPTEASVTLQSTETTWRGNEGQSTSTSTYWSSAEQNINESLVSQSKGAEEQITVVPTESTHSMGNWSSGEMEAAWDELLEKNDAALSPAILKIVGKRSFAEPAMEETSSRSINPQGPIAIGFSQWVHPSEVLGNTSSGKKAAAQMHRARALPMPYLSSHEHPIYGRTKFTRRPEERSTLYQILKISKMYSGASTQPSHPLRALVQRGSVKRRDSSRLFPLQNGEFTGLPVQLDTTEQLLHTKRTLVSAAEMYQHKEICGFEQGLCGWKQSTADDLDWSFVLGRGRPRTQHYTNGDTPGGVHISLKNQSMTSIPGQKALLLSPILQDPKCLSFWYGSLGYVMGTLNVYTRPVDKVGGWHWLWSSGGQPHTGWTKAQIELIPQQLSPNVQVAVEGVLGPSADSNSLIDNLCIGQCGGCEL
ncbi:hypothetical protein FKM82_012173 [Ascaphus truei]